MHSAGAVNIGAPAASVSAAPWTVTPQPISGAVDLPVSCKDPDSEAETFLASEPVNPNHLAAVWSAGAPDSNTTISAASTDGGMTWTRTPIYGTGPCTDGPGDYVIDAWTSIGRDGRSYYDSFAGRVQADEDTADKEVLVAVSGPRGAAMGSWSRAVTLDDNESGARGVISRTSITADPNQRDRAWAVWGRFLDPLVQGIYVSRTDDGGKSWNAPVRVVDVRQDVVAPWQLVVRPAGDLVLFYAEFDAVGFAVTQGLAQAWPEPVRAIRSIDNGDHWFDVHDVTVEPALTVGRAASGPDGSLVFAWDELDENKVDETKSVDTVWVARSIDGGRFWSKTPVGRFSAGPLKNRIEGTVSVSPDVAVNDDGVIGVSYYAGSDKDDRKIARWFAHSGDEGKTWTRQLLSAPFTATTSCDLLAPCQQRGNGDGPQGAYQGIAPLGHGFGATFIVGTEDPENPTEVMFARIMPPD
jgi:hypothetical protein